MDFMANVILREDYNVVMLANVLLCKAAREAAFNELGIEVRCTTRHTTE